MSSVNLSSENTKFAKTYAAKIGMSLADCVNHFLPRGIKRDMALQKNRGAAPVKRKDTKKAGKKSSKRSNGKSNGKKTYSAAALLKMKKSGGLTNAQVSKKTGLSKDQVYRILKRG